jgi:hypothetical protein
MKQIEMANKMKDQIYILRTLVALKFINFFSFVYDKLDSLHCVSKIHALDDFDRKQNILGKVVETTLLLSRDDGYSFYEIFMHNF